MNDNDSILSAYIPHPIVEEVDHVDVAVAPHVAYAAVRQGDLARAPAARALFALRFLPNRVRGERPSSFGLTVDDIVAPGSGFRLLGEHAGEAFVVGAIGKFWRPSVEIEDFHGVDFVEFAEPGVGKLAWCVRVEPRGRGSRILLELRVTTTDDEARQRFQRYWKLVGRFSRYIRHAALLDLQKRLGALEDADKAVALPGDGVLGESKAQVTHGVDIEATPAEIWPWLVQMGCDRGGWYSHDRLDNAGRPSATAVVPELQNLKVGDVLPARPGSKDGFVVVELEPERALVLASFTDLTTRRSLPLDAESPVSFWKTSWAFVLEPLDGHNTRLTARARVDFEPSWIEPAAWLVAAPIHHFMEREQLYNLKELIEGTRPKAHDELRDIAEGAGGALRIAAAVLSPFRRGTRSHWGLSQELVEREYPGDEHVKPRWSWTHGIEVDAPVEQVWPWVAQIGQNKGGFYSYQWLENLIGCDIENADVVREEWQDLSVGSEVSFGRKWPPARVAAVEPGRWFYLSGRTDLSTGDDYGDGDRPERFADTTWLFFVEPLPEGRSRVVSRFRADYSDDLATRLMQGPTFTEPIGFVMERKMLLGIKERAERDVAR